MRNIKEMDKRLDEREQEIEILQQAKDKLQNDYQNAVDKITNLRQENKQLKERFENLVQEHIDTINRNEEKQQRIDKTIEYIKEHNVIAVNKEHLPTGIERCCSAELLEILGDKE